MESIFSLFLDLGQTKGEQYEQEIEIPCFMS